MGYRLCPPPGAAGQSQDGVDRDSSDGPDARAEAKVKASDISKIDSIGKNSSKAILGSGSLYNGLSTRVRNCYAVTEEGLGDADQILGA